MIILSLILFVCLICVIGLMINSVRLENEAIKEEIKRRQSAPWTWD